MFLGAGSLPMLILPGRQKTGAIKQHENLLEGTPEIEFWPLCSGDTWVDNELLIK
jgi:hypothetical protein